MAASGETAKAEVGTRTPSIAIIAAALVFLGVAAFTSEAAACPPGYTCPLAEGCTDVSQCTPPQEPAAPAEPSVTQPPAGATAEPTAPPSAVQQPEGRDRADRERARREAEDARRSAVERTKKNLGYEEVEPTEGGGKREQDWEGLGEQIRRLGNRLSVVKEPPEDIVIPGDGGGEHFGEEPEKCKDCDYRITSIIKKFEGLEIPAGYPTLDVEEVNFRSQADRAGAIRAFADIQNAMGKLTAAIGIAGGLMTGGVGAAAIELAGFLFGEKFANPGDLFKDPDALARGLSRGITKITLKMPVLTVNARTFNLVVCESGHWKPFKGLHFAWEGPRKLEMEVPLPQTGGAGTIADYNRALLENAVRFARDMYKQRVANLARLRAFLKEAKVTTPSACKLDLSEGDFRGVHPVGAVPEPAKKKKDCSAILAKIKRAEADKAALEARLAGIEGNLEFLKGRLANLKGKLAEARAKLKKTEADIRRKRANLESVDAMLDSIRGKARGGGILTADENASLDRLAGLRRRYQGELEGLESAHAAQRATAESLAGQVTDAEAGIRDTTNAIKEAKAEIAAADATIDALRAEYKRCMAENR